MTRDLAVSSGEIGRVAQAVVPSDERRPIGLLSRARKKRGIGVPVRQNHARFVSHGLRLSAPCEAREMEEKDRW